MTQIEIQEDNDGKRMYMVTLPGLKTRNKRFNYISQETYECLMRHTGGRAGKIYSYEKDYLRWKVNKALSQIGFEPHPKTHDLRKSKAMHEYEDSGKDLRHVMNLLGHADLKTTSGYLLLDQDSLKDEMKSYAKQRAGFSVKNQSHINEEEEPVKKRKKLRRQKKKQDQEEDKGDGGPKCQPTLMEFVGRGENKWKDWIGEQGKRAIQLAASSQHSR